MSAADKPKQFVLSRHEARALSSIHSSFPLRFIPPPLRPYAELARIHRPAGIMMFYFPFLYGTFLVGSLGHAIPPSTMLATNGKLLALCVLLRSWLCTWNDIIDADIDRGVSRTKIRPLARYAISARAAWVYVAAQTLLVVLSFSLLSAASVAHAAPFLALHSTYPFAKRVTHHPQLILGFAHCLGVFVAFPAFGQLLFSGEAAPDNVLAATCLSLAIVFWTLLNDTIYAAQDLEDDKKIGVGSTMVYWGDAARNFLRVLAVCQAGFLFAVAWPIRNSSLEGILGSSGEAAATSSAVYTALTGCGTALGLLSMVELVDLHDPASCGWWFNRGNVWLGVVIGSGLVGEYFERSLQLTSVLGLRL